MQLVTTNGLLDHDVFLESLAQKIVEVQQRSNLPATDTTIEQPTNAQGAADHIGFDVQTIYRMVRAGDIPSHKRNGRLFFFKSELNEWIKNSTL